jgi:Asp-tRNA(Asn)/Glu-tRNA(Gln) amidotransferase A subunit family amidase
LCTRPPRQDYTRYLDSGALKGARIGIPRAFFYDTATPPGMKEPRGGLTPDQAKVMNEAIEILKQQGAIIVDPADIPSIIHQSADGGHEFHIAGAHCGQRVHDETGAEACRRFQRSRRIRAESDAPINDSVVCTSKTEVSLRVKHRLHELG